MTRSEKKHSCFNHRLLRGPAAFVFSLLFTGWFFLLGGKYTVRSLFERMYTPPALNSENLPVYSKFVTLAASHPEYKQVRVTYHGYPKVETYDSMLESAYPSTNVESIWDELHEIASEMRRVDCILAEKDGNYVAFVPDETHILPRIPGVLYSLDGTNPNEVDDEFLNGKKPLVPIKDDWYMSRQLGAFIYSRFDKRPLPESALIDRSLRDPGIAPVENR